MSRQAKPSVAVVGAGAVGSVLAHGLAAAAYRIEAVVSRSGAEALAEQCGAPVASDRLEDVPPADLVLLCVPDDAIPAVAEQLADAGRWQGRVAAHTSGALSAHEALAPLAARGAEVLGFHPAQTIPPGADPTVLHGAAAGLDGTPTAVALGRRLADDLGLRPVVLPEGAKARYHLAAVLASNYMVTLAALSEEALTSAGIAPADARALLAPLRQATARSLAERAPADALTGPIARGDAGTLRRHLDALRTHLSHLVPPYVALAHETLRLTEGRLSAEQAEALREVLET